MINGSLIGTDCGTGVAGKCVYTYAHTVRCVLDLSTYQLCDWYSGYGSLQCSYGIGSCPGAHWENCYPNDVWSSTVMDAEGYHRGFYLASGVLHGTSCDNTRGKCANDFAFTVRCVLDLHIIQTRLPADQLCDWYAGYGSLQCYARVGSCPGAGPSSNWANNCYPHNVWSSAEGATDWRYSIRIETGVPKIESFPATLALGVRCVLDLGMPTADSSATIVAVTAPCLAIIS